MAEGFEPVEFLLDQNTFYSEVPGALSTQLYADVYTDAKLSRRSRETGQACSGCIAYIQDLPPGESHRLTLRRLSGEGRDIVVTFMVGEEIDSNRGARLQDPLLLLGVERERPLLPPRRGRWTESLPERRPDIGQRTRRP